MTDQPTPEPLHARLRRHVHGVLACAAAVELVIAHQMWLDRTAFLDAFTYTYTGFDTGQASTGIEWGQAVAALDQGRLACSPGEAQILRIAGSLARGIPVDLGDAATRLDRTNTRLVTSAITRAAGHAEAEARN